MRDAPYRVIVWGPGVLGSLLLREILARPELELVGVLAYSAAKSGVDIGTYLGSQPLGVEMTTDKERVFGLDADCVLFCPQATAGVDLGSQTTADLCRLLETGKNVVTASGYHYPVFHGHELVDHLESACQAGKASLHSTGINPGFMCERLATTLSAVCSKIDTIVVQEIGLGATVESADMMSMIGWGQPPPPANEIVELAARYYGEGITHACAILGRTVDRIVPEVDFVLAERDYQLGTFTVPKGTMGCVTHTFTAMVDGQPFFRLEEYFIADVELAPTSLTSPDHYTITIEGAPISIRASIDMKHSFARDQRFPSDDHAPPAYYATAVPMIQAIPVVCAAPPGLVYPTVFTRNVPRLSMLESP